MEEYNRKSEGDDDTYRVWCNLNNMETIGKGTGRLGNKRKSREHQDYIIIMIGQNTEKSPGDLKIFAVTQPPVRNHPVMLVWKTLKRVDDHNNHNEMRIHVVSQTSVKTH